MTQEEQAKLKEILETISACNERLAKLETSIKPLLNLIKANEPPPLIKEAMELFKSIGPEILTKIGTVGTDFDQKDVWFKIVTSGGFTYSVKKCSDGIRIRKRDMAGQLVGKEITGLSPNALPKAILSLATEPA